MPTPDNFMPAGPFRFADPERNLERLDGRISLLGNLPDIGGTAYGRTHPICPPLAVRVALDVLGVSVESWRPEVECQGVKLPRRCNLSTTPNGALYYLRIVPSGLQAAHRAEVEAVFYPTPSAGEKLALRVKWGQFWAGVALVTRGRDRLTIPLLVTADEGGLSMHVAPNAGPVYGVDELGAFACLSVPWPDSAAQAARPFLDSRGELVESPDEEPNDGPQDAPQAAPTTDAGAEDPAPVQAPQEAPQARKKAPRAPRRKVDLGQLDMDKAKGQ